MLNTYIGVLDAYIRRFYAKVKQMTAIWGFIWTKKFIYCTLCGILWSNTAVITTFVADCLVLKSNTRLSWCIWVKLTEKDLTKGMNVCSMPFYPLKVVMNAA